MIEEMKAAAPEPAPRDPEEVEEAEVEAPVVEEGTSC